MTSDLFGHDSTLGLRKKEWSAASETQREVLIEKIFSELRAQGFPHFNLTLHTRKKIVTQLAAFSPDTIINGDSIAQNMLGQDLLNHHMPHIWSVRSTGFITPMEAFQSDSKLKSVIAKRLLLGDNISLAGIRKTLGFANGAQKVSSFRPTAAKAIYSMFLPTKVLDFSAGFGGRLLGAMSCRHIKHYLGVDPSTTTTTALREMIALYSWNNRAQIIHAAFEDTQLPKNHFDLAFSSPPYFNTEQYSNDPTQSYLRYPTRFSWRNGFLRPTILKCFNALKHGGTFAINVANVATYPNLEGDTVSDALSAGFTQTKTLRLAFSKLMGADFKYEPIFVFTK